MLAAWVAFPLALAVLAAGVGLLVERAGGHRLPGPLLWPIGFAGLVCVTQLVTLTAVSAPLTPYVVVVLALAGYALSVRRLREAQPDPWTAAAAVAVFIAYAAPALFTGAPTFLGYSNLGDASIHFELVDRLMRPGPSLDGLVPSSFRGSLEAYFTTSYPTGGHTVLGAVRPLSGTDVAWVFQPYLSVLAAFVALGLQPLARAVTERRWLAAGVAGLAAQAALVYAYAVHQQAIKELATLVTVLALVGCVGPLLAARPGWRAPIPLAVAAAGALGVLSVAVVPWAGPVLVVALVALLVRHGVRRVVPAAAGFSVLALLLAIPTLDRLSGFVNTAKVTLTSVNETGNLPRPLEFVQAFGVWPAPDFRLPLPDGRGFAYVLVGAAALASGLGVIEIVRRRAWPVALLAGVSVVGFLAVAGRSSPWAYGKSLMLLSPAILLVAGYAAAAWWDARRRAEAAVLAAALLTGVLWTNAQSYHGVDAAPHDRLSELESIGQRFAGQGPAVYFEFEEYAKHFLRELDPTGALEAFRPAWPEGAYGASTRFGFSSDVEDWSPESLARHFELLVVRQGPTVSRPPSTYTRALHGSFYDVWRREAAAPRVLSHVRLGSRTDAAEKADCRRVRRVARRAMEAGGWLVVAERPPVAAAHVTRADPPRRWTIDAGDHETWRPVGQGRVVVPMRAPAGTYRVWMEASVGRPATITVDGRRVGTIANSLNPRLSAVPVGTVTLEGDRHRVQLDVAGGSPDPRNGGLNRLLGPIYFTPAEDPAADPVRTMAASAWRSLCGVHADWIEAVSPVPTG